MNKSLDFNALTALPFSAYTNGQTSSRLTGNSSLSFDILNTSSKYAFISWSVLCFVSCKILLF